MELEGLKSTLSSLLDQEFDVYCIVTDRHASIMKWLDEDHPEIKVFNDICHTCKSKYTYILLQYCICSH